MSQATRPAGASTDARRPCLPARAASLALACLLLAAILLGWANQAPPSAGFPAGPDPGLASRAPGDDGGIPAQDGRVAAAAKSRRLPPMPVARLPSAGDPSVAIGDRRIHVSRSLAPDRNLSVSTLESLSPARAPRLPLHPSQAPPSA